MRSIDNKIKNNGKMKNVDNLSHETIRNAQVNDGRDHSFATANAVFLAMARAEGAPVYMGTIYCGKKAHINPYER